MVVRKIKHSLIKRYQEPPDFRGAAGDRHRPPLGSTRPEPVLRPSEPRSPTPDPYRYRHLGAVNSRA
jgi:hypothetical protein